MTKDTSNILISKCISKEILNAIRGNSSIQADELLLGISIDQIEKLRAQYQEKLKK